MKGVTLIGAGRILGRLPWMPKSVALSLDRDLQTPGRKIAAQHTEKRCKMPPINAPVPTDIQTAPCPCGGTASLADCCLPLLQGHQTAETAEQLMRSRYTAHVLMQIDYLWQTWDASTRRRSTREQIQTWAASCDWLNLEILATDRGQPGDTEGRVNFVALYRQGGELHQHHEVSLFRQLGNRWFYVDHLEPDAF